MIPDYFYYIVFNLSGDSEKKPYSVFEGEDRGKYWNIYYMYGRPPFRDLGLYRGYGGIGPNDEVLIDMEPLERAYLNELLPGTDVSGDHMVLRIDLTKLKLPTKKINMNMIVCNQAIDAKSQIEYEYDPLVWDSFYGRGITMDLGGTTDFWNEFNNRMEDKPNEREDVAPPGADIKNWRFQIISQ
jgi:hypothetical protein